MTIETAIRLGYGVVVASACEIGLTKNGKCIRTWWMSDFDNMPGLDHPEIQRAIRIQEELDGAEYPQ